METMQERLAEKLYSNLVEHHPDILLSLQEERKVTGYVQDKVRLVQPIWQSLEEKQVPDYLVVETCIEQLTADLWPSRYQYLSELMEEEFTAISEHWRESGVGTYEVINLITQCNTVFEETDFSAANVDSVELRFRMIDRVRQCMEIQ